MSSFVHLHLHSHFSFLRSSIREKQLCQAAAAAGMPAVALTDDANLFGAPQFCRAARAAGVKPILGCDLYLTRGAMSDRPESGSPDSRLDRLTVLVTSSEGYKNLGQLLSLAYVEGFHRKPRVDDATLSRYSGGLIALSGGNWGRISTLYTQGQLEEAETAAIALRDIFGAENFFLELQDHGEVGQGELNAWLAGLGTRIGVGLVATNDPHFLKPEDFEAHRALTCIGTGTTLDDKPVLSFTQEHYFRSAEEMAELFADHPSAIENTLHVAERCNYQIESREPAMPEFEVPDGETMESYFRKVCQEGLNTRLERLNAGPQPPSNPREDYDARLLRELDVICDMGFPGYFLITWDLIRHARDSGIPVGPGRGSAAGSLVAYVLWITDLDPLEHGLMFERFLNPERRSLPDIDMDFCQRRRAEMIRYTQERYGEDRVAQIITFGTLSAKSVIRDVGRVMNMTYGEVDRVAKMIPDDLGITLKKALEESTALADAVAEDALIKKLVDTACQLEGCARNPGIHAAGVIIAPQPLAELVPLFRTGRDEITTQFSWEEAEAVGLLKMDFLGLKTLTVLHDAVRSIERAGLGTVVLEDLPIDDEATYELFRQARTTGIFQFESSGMREVLRKLAPETFVDITAMNALYRPGPLKAGVIDDYIDRRHGRIEVKYPLEELKPILESTYGIMAFQEQVMQVAVELAGYSLGEADNLRKAMGKKKAEVMEGQKVKFLEGAAARGVDKQKAIEVFELMEFFAGYGFNKSHSAAYALVAYWCAYLKAHHPAHFMAGLLTSDRDNTAKVVRYIAECRELGIEVLPPDVNESETDFTVIDDTHMRFGLSAIKGVGLGAVSSILDARKESGRFKDLHSFCADIDLRLNNKKVLEALVKAGALDSLGGRRSALMLGLEDACDAAAAIQADRKTGQASLFGGPSEEEGGEFVPVPLPDVPEWSTEDRLRHEKDVLGFYVSGHPLERHAELLESITSAKLADLAERGGKEATVVGIVTGLRKMRTKKGDWMAFLAMEDLTGHAEVVVFPRTWAECESFVATDAALAVKGKVETDAEPAKILAEEVRLLDQAEEEAANGLVLRLPTTQGDDALEELLAQTDDILASSPGDCPVSFQVSVESVGEVTVRAAKRFSVKPDPAVVKALEGLMGDGRVSVTYR